MTKQLSSQKRKRGVILSSGGWQRLQAAEQQAAIRDNAGKPYTLEQLSQQTKLSINTLTKVRRRQIAVDRQTLECYFNAFELAFNTEDYTTLEFHYSPLTYEPPLEGQLPIDSPLYIYRPPAEQMGCEALLEPGAMIRIKAPRQFGKTSLMSQVLMHAQKQQFHTVVLSLQLADSSVLEDLNRFLRWFCAVVARSLGLQNHLADYWDDVFGNSYSCTDYFESYLLPSIKTPLVLALDEADIVFNCPQIAPDFFGMLRAWHERAKYGNAKSSIWQQLRLIIVHTTEIYLPLHFSQSPFNVGILIELPEFNLEQVEDLIQRYGLTEEDVEASQLINLVGGHPYLLQLALYHLSQQTMTLEQLVQTAIAPNSIFSAHLRRQLGCLQPYPDLLNAMQQIVLQPNTTQISPSQAFKLQNMGLIRLHDQRVIPSCRLYQQYFSQIFSLLPL